MAAAGGDYNYSKLRAALVAIAPQVQKIEDKPHAARQWRKGGNASGPAQQVHVVEDAEPGEGKDGGDNDSNQPCEDLEAELHVLLTQAARKRSALQRARGFSTKTEKGESQAARERRIKDMKARLPCTLCKSHGKTVFGHWHGDEACPYFTRKAKGAAANRDKNVMAVELSDSEEDLMLEESMVCLTTVFTDTSPNCQSLGGDEMQGEGTVCLTTVFTDTSANCHSLQGNQMPEESVVCLSTVFTATSANRQSHREVALTGTCCARTVAGQ